MGTVQFNKEKIEKAVSKIKSGTKTLENAKNKLSRIDIPDDFSYSSKIKNYKGSSSGLNDNFGNFASWLQNQVDEYEVIMKKAVNYTNSIEPKDIPKMEYMSSGSDAQPIIIDENEKKAIEFVNKYFDWSKYENLMTKDHPDGIFELFYNFQHLSEYDQKKLISQKLYEEYGLKINSEDIVELNVNDSGFDGSYIQLTLSDGTKITIGDTGISIYDGINKMMLVLEPNGQIKIIDMEQDKEYALTDLYLKITYYPLYELSLEEQEQLRKEFNLVDGVPIKGYSILIINGHETKVYWVGDDVDYEDFQKNLKMIEEQMSIYPSNVLNRVFNTGHFKGFLIGTKKSTNVNCENWTAFAHLDQYIYIIADKYDFNKKSTVFHEFAHILDSALDNGRGHFTINNLEIKTLYEKYRKIIQEIPELSCNGYCNSNQYPDGVPDVKEFFATIVELYFSRPDDLKELLPEVYNYVDNLLKNV